MISATTELDNLTRTARLSAEECDRVADLKQHAIERAATLDRDTAAAEARRAGLVESEGYKKGQELDRLRENTGKALNRATVLRGDAQVKRATADDDARKHEDAVRAAQLHADAASAHEIETGHAATRAGLAGVHRELTGYLTTDSTQIRPFLRAAVSSRHDQLAAVGTALDAHERAVERREQAEEELDAANTVLAEAGERLGTARELHENAITALAERVVGWALGCQELRFPDPRALADLVESESAVLSLVDAVAATALEEITRHKAAQEAALAATCAERDGLAAEERKLAAEHDIPPVAPPTRTTDRSRMVGAPLWQLVEFAATVPDTATAGIEAALEASGLLDAWVGRHGQIEGHDVFAESSTRPPVDGRSLRDVLTPVQRGGDVDPPVDPLTVERLLATVAFDDRLPAEASAAIGADGSWRMGAITGSWQKNHAAYIGATARQLARERRRVELRAQIGELDVTIATLEAELASLRARRDLLAAERAGRPAHDELDAAVRDLSTAESDRAAADTVVRRCAAAVSTREAQVRAALRALTSLAAEHGTPAERESLRLLTAAVTTFRDQAESWIDAHGRLTAARSTAETLAEHAARSEAAAEQRESEADESEAEHARLMGMLDAIDGALIADYREVLAEIASLRTTLKQLDIDTRATRQEITALAEKLGELSARRTTDAQVRDAAATKRDAASVRFRHLAAGVLPADSGLGDLAKFEALLAASDGVRAALDAARVVAAAWPSIPHAPNNLGDALHRLSESVHAVRTTLSARADLELETDEDVQIFIAIVDGVRVGAAQLLDILQADAERSRHEITEKERALFDQTLTGDTRRHLAARIRQANELVDGMNARLERVRTASKVAVRLVWQVAPDLPTGTKAARDLLLKDPVRLTDQDRDSLHQFFRERIEQAKADDTAASWEQQLAQVFDYTAWHRFAVKIDRANGDGWQPLTKKLHGALSGGEKAIALHLPLFAAVAAHYQVAPEAPRIILLDEVFVGVDSTNRGQVFALLSALELDLMLTSDHEWCTYSELSGIGIHQLITGSDGDDAVTTARFTWNGHDLLPADD
ncbi:MAG: TIGR02680 family protein [Pseudonocardia sp.]|uniref:TIGR02680 family protein n=1 Tax=Mycolicibacterium sp. TaxID=2320850 RepID=UPI003D1119F2